MKLRHHTKAQRFCAAAVLLTLTLGIFIFRRVRRGY